MKFPVTNGVPILINESNSVFAVEDFIQGRTTYFREESRVRQVAKRVIPDFKVDTKSTPNFTKFTELVRNAGTSPRVLVIGGGILGVGMEVLANASDIELVETDVSLGPRTKYICDAHDIPFEDGSFDGVIAQAVLEHVVDPYRCVAEIWRVLKTAGYVYAETPFMQQVHGGKFDFTRFTYLGHRRLFRHFAQVDAGIVGGSALALGWAYRYFLLSFVSEPVGRAFMQAFARLTAFWLKYLDRFLINKAGSFDAASAYYFLGRKSNDTLSDRDLLGQYRGGS
jgi:SAM-dependent methyltransferase